MGIHICVETVDGKQHGEWDSCRYAGDSIIPDALRSVGTVDHFVDEFEIVQRPKSVVDFVNKMIELTPSNHSRWRQLGKILRDDRWWLRVSV